MQIHCRTEYEFMKYGSLWVTPAGSVTLDGYNNKKRPVYWFPWNWVLLVVISPLWVIALVKSRKAATGKDN